MQCCKIRKLKGLNYIFFMAHDGIPSGGLSSMGSPSCRGNTMALAFSLFFLIIFRSRLWSTLVNSSDLHVNGWVLITFLGLFPSSSDPIARSSSLSVSYELTSGDIASNNRADLIFFRWCSLKAGDVSVIFLRRRNF